jgi:hypothetical protein
VDEETAMPTENATPPIHQGGCLCGAIRYSVVGDPVAVSLCHCVNCQRNSGSAFSVNVIFPRNALTMHGSPAVYEDRGDTGEIVRRLFCGTCGTPLESQSVFSAPICAVLKAGSFDNPAQFTPDSELYCISAMPWWTDGSERKHYDRLNIDDAGVTGSPFSQ